jgi:hypothetical protein
MEREPQPSREQEGEEATTQEISAICCEVLGSEVDCDFEGLEANEALGDAFTLLIDGGYDPIEIFRKYGVIINPEDEKDN